MLPKMSGPRMIATCAAVLLLFSSVPRGAPTPMTTQAVIDRFNAAFNAHDFKTVESLLTDDTVVEDTSPAPDGRRIVGKRAVAAFWKEWFCAES